MSARCCARALLGRGSRRTNVRRGFATTPRRPGPDPAASRPVDSNQTSGWSGLRVLAVAAGAGAAGWGLASVSGQGDAKGLFGAKSASRYATLPEMEEAMRKIEKEIGIEDIISTDADDLHAHGYSEWSSVNLDTLPVAVAYPRNTEDVSVIARICHEYRIPIIPYSGGSSLEGNFSAPYGGVSVDFAYMNQIVEFNKEDMDIVVQPSIGWQDLNEKLARMESGLFFPIDPGTPINRSLNQPEPEANTSVGPSAKIGGMIGTNCSGTNAVRYGTMKDWVINLTVVLADGRIIKTRRRPRKSSAGYNLNSLFVGSEGTLGLVTEATLKLAVVPEQYSVAVVTFPSIRDAAAAAAGVMQTGVPIAAMEIMDEVQMKVVNLGGATFPRVWKEVPTLFFKFSGTKEGVRDAITRVQKITAANKGGNFEFARDEREQKLLWSARKESLWSMLSLRKEGEETWSTDVAVPFSRLADIIEVSKKEMDDLGLFASILGHIGDGNFHESIMYNREIPGEREKVEKCIKNMVKRALDMEGTCTGEHGIGWGKKESLLWEVGPETLAVMGSLKGSLDPRWVMNPGKIVDVPWLGVEYPDADKAVTPVRKLYK
ncbi:FAD-linked oxidase-like protein [Dactylonectria macrodidyma]|uniref:D-lactate dehydrogenase (cytochrome) n=1 Tax=Dactylonectria macrodidyma TaxID=307937 RepID=A0A9P9JNA9_9HYPO|nr:FAD-linked oxidase-like protein [Dactylonectria macrodidyma]